VKKEETRLIRQTSKKIQAKFLPEGKVKLVLTKKVNDPEDFGSAECVNNGFLITIYTHYGLHVCIDTLMHEWAHVLAGWTNHHTEHTFKWGHWYTRIFQYLEQEEK